MRGLVSRRFCAANFALIAVLAGCSRGAVPSASSNAGGAPGAAHHGTLRLVIKVPPKKKAHRAIKRGKFVSPATQSMTVAISGAATKTLTANLTPTSNGCSSTLATTTCTLSLDLAPGTYDAAISTFDGLSGDGALLSAGQAIDFNIVAGASNNIPVTLSGIPHSLRLSQLGLAVQQTAASPTFAFTLTGLFPGKMLAYALDADDDIIVGPGAPTMAVTQTSGTAFTIANPSTTSPNVFSLTGPGTDGVLGEFALTASYADATCSLAGAVCTAAFAVKAHAQSLIVTNVDGSEVLFTPPYTGASTRLPGFEGNRIIPTGSPQSTAFDAAGNFYVIDTPSYLLSGLLMIAPPYTGAPTWVENIVQGSAIARGPNGSIFIANYVAGAGSITQYPSSTSIANGISGPKSIGFDASGNMFVANVDGAGGVSEYAPPYAAGATPVELGGGPVTQVAVASTGDVFAGVPDPSNPSVIERFTPPYGGTFATVASGYLVSPVVGPNDVLYYADLGASGIVAVAPPYAAVSGTIADANVPRAITFDGAGDMIVTNFSTVSIYAPPYTGTPTILYSGVSNAFDTAVTP